MREHCIDDLHLVSAWWQLTLSVANDRVFDEKTFLQLFHESYAVMRQYSTKLCIRREVMDLFKNISAFLGTRFTPINNAHSAACELTDAMLMHCFCNEKQDTLTSKGTWCLLQEDTEVDFDEAEWQHFMWTLDIEKLSAMGLW